MKPFRLHDDIGAPQIAAMLPMHKAYAMQSLTLTSAQTTLERLYFCLKIFPTALLVSANKCPMPAYKATFTRIERVTPITAVIPGRETAKSMIMDGHTKNIQSEASFLKDAME